jgi:predicted metal-dependent phosphoesterase TrpH
VAVRDARLVLPAGYLLLAPVCNTLDAISLFSGRQHFAFLVTVAVVYAAWRLLRQRRAGKIHVRCGKETLVASLALLAVVTLYAAGTMLARPLARLAMSAPDDVVIDFHSHTSFSWDGRRDFPPEANRLWHRTSGFDVAYITDHGSFDGALQAALRNPARAGDGTVLLSGIEVRSDGEHLDILGTDAGDAAAYKGDTLAEGIFLRKVRVEKPVPPLVLLTLPGQLHPEQSAVPIDAVEISDGAPRALSEIDTQRASILRLAREHGAALVAGSNNHGWASASPAWSVMAIPGWRSMTPSQLDAAIRSTFFRRGSKATRVIARVSRAARPRTAATRSAP